MNYRHGYHAGNFADVMKHAVLARIMTHLRSKAAAFRVIETHAGPGLYDLAGAEAAKTGEWREGIARLSKAALPPAVADLFAPYLDTVAAYNPDSREDLRAYPGSPLLIQAWLRPVDRAVLCEMHPEAAATLAGHLRRDNRIKAVHLDGWTALNAFLPPPERRGLVVIDPPYEAADEFARLAAALIKARRKWETGVFMAWYPIKDRKGPSLLMKQMLAAKIPKILVAEIARDGAAVPSPRTKASGAGVSAGGLGGSGLLIINPPWQLDRDLAAMLPALCTTLSAGPWRSNVDWIARDIVN